MTTKTKSKPMIFGAESVRAILDGRKTQTRHVITKCQELEIGRWIPPEITPTCSWFALKGETQEIVHQIACPFPPGTVVWVRETMWRSGGYVATDPPDHEKRGKISPIFMSRDYSRLSIEIVNVRVERVQDISAEDAYAEGMRCPQGHPPHKCNCVCGSYETLWNEINAKRGFTFYSNPWVWVYELKKINP